MVGFGARRLFDDDGIEAKYLNTSDTSVYHKTKVLFGLDLAKREIAKRRQVDKSPRLPPPASILLTCRSRPAR